MSLAYRNESHGNAVTTVKDIAQLANVSVATVSRTFRSPDRVAKKTRERVLKAAKETGFQPDALAQNFRTGRSNAIMVLVPNISNPFFSKVLRSMQATASERGYSVVLGDTDGQKNRETAYGAFFSRRQADGLIQLGPRAPQSFLSCPVTPSSPIVHACEGPRRSRYPSVRIDNADAAEAMTQHLVDTGRRRIAVLTGPPAGPLTRERLSGWKKCLEQSNLQTDDHLVLTGDFTLNAGSEGAKRLLELSPRPDALFCFNDEMAIGAVQTLKGAGLRIPRDIAVAGFDDIDVARFCDPPLTTIAQPKSHIGSMAMEMVLDLIDNKKIERLNRVLKAKLVIRDSTVD